MIYAHSTASMKSYELPIELAYLVCEELPFPSKMMLVLQIWCRMSAGIHMNPVRLHARTNADVDVMEQFQWKPRFLKTNSYLILRLKHCGLLELCEDIHIDMRLNVQVFSELPFLEFLCREVSYTYSRLRRFRINPWDMKGTLPEVCHWENGEWIGIKTTYCALYCNIKYEIPVMFCKNIRNIRYVYVAGQRRLTGLFAGSFDVKELLPTVKSVFSSDRCERESHVNDVTFDGTLPICQLDVMTARYAMYRNKAYQLHKVLFSIHSIRNNTLHVLMMSRWSKALTLIREQKLKTSYAYLREIRSCNADRIPYIARTCPNLEILGVHVTGYPWESFLAALTSNPLMNLIQLRIFGMRRNLGVVDIGTFSSTLQNLCFLEIDYNLAVRMDNIPCNWTYISEHRYYEDRNITFVRCFDGIEAYVSRQKNVEPML